MDSPANVIHEDDLNWIETEQSAAFRSRRKKLGGAAGARMLGASLYELPPGASAFPYHYHCANEELLYVLAGEGILRLGEEQIPVRAGSFIAIPPGPAHAHRLCNSSTAPLSYLCVSTMIDPEVCIYPDSKKVAVAVGSAPGGDLSKRTLAGVYRLASSIGYYDGEPGA
ncbi:MAG TPA: cupin domain-containing protein [Candidatus Binataceae bacterium]|nr:cupin domain-containing protein [Candidatus Binataceae bacterium]